MWLENNQISKSYYFEDIWNLIDSLNWLIESTSLSRSCCEMGGQLSSIAVLWAGRGVTGGRDRLLDSLLLLALFDINPMPKQIKLTIEHSSHGSKSDKHTHTLPLMSSLSMFSTYKEDSLKKHFLFSKSNWKLNLTVSQGPWDDICCNLVPFK